MEFLSAVTAMDAECEGLANYQLWDAWCSIRLRVVDNLQIAYNNARAEINCRTCNSPSGICKAHSRCETCVAFSNWQLTNNNHEVVWSCRNQNYTIYKNGKCITTTYDIIKAKSYLECSDKFKITA